MLSRINKILLIIDQPTTRGCVHVCYCPVTMTVFVNYYLSIIDLFLFKVQLYIS